MRGGHETLLPRSPSNALRVLFESSVHRYTVLVGDASEIAKRARALPPRSPEERGSLVQVGWRGYVFLTYSQLCFYSDYFSLLLFFSLNQRERYEIRANENDRNVILDGGFMNNVKRFAVSCTRERKRFSY